MKRVFSISYQASVRQRRSFVRFRDFPDTSCQCYCFFTPAANDAIGSRSKTIDFFIRHRNRAIAVDPEISFKQVSVCLSPTCL